MRKIVFGMMTMIFLCPVLSFGADVNLAWDANTEPDLAGYKIHRGTAKGGPYEEVANLGTVTAWTDVGLGDGLFCWVATAYDAVGNESGYSNEVCLQVDTTPPQGPRNIRVLGVVK